MPPEGGTPFATAAGTSVPPRPWLPPPVTGPRPVLPSRSAHIPLVEFLVQENLRRSGFRGRHRHCLRTGLQEQCLALGFLLRQLRNERAKTAGGGVQAQLVQD